MQPKSLVAVAATALAGCDVVFAVDAPVDAVVDTAADSTVDSSVDASVPCVDRPIILRPSSPRMATWQQVPTTGTHADHVFEVVADDDASYIASGTDGQVETFDHDGAVPSDATVDSVTVWIRARMESDSTFAEVGPALDSNPVLAWSDRVIGTSWSDYSGSIYTTNPTTNAPWTVEQVNAIAFGVRKSYENARVRVTQIWAVVQCH